MNSFMKLQCKEELVTSLSMDHLFKAILIKIDDIMENNERVINESVEM
jgi:hypothetical protein